MHVLPDGRRINYGKNGMTIGAPFSLGARVSPSTHGHHASALTTSFMRGYDDRYSRGSQSAQQLDVPTIDTTYPSNPPSAYGSPRDDDMARFLGLSPNANGLSVLDAPLPASFDSNGISLAARYGPWPSSMPSQFGLESPKLQPAKDMRTDALSSLHRSAFGGNLSPSTDAEVPHGKRMPVHHLHSSSRYHKPRLLSSSVPKVDREWGSVSKVDRDWEPGFLFEEDYVPGALANEVLTPAEKARRGSNNMTRPDDAEGARFGSPIGASSPSRWGPLFQRQKDEEADGNFGRKHGPSAFGHVGSPLRNSRLADGLASPGPGSRGTASPAGESLTVLTAQLRLTQLADDVESSSCSPGASSPHLRASRPLFYTTKDRDRVFDRHISNGSIGSSPAGRFASPIDEEDPAFVFPMEEEDDRDRDAAARARKRVSGGRLGAASPLSSAWSYAAAVSSTVSSTRDAGKAVTTA